MILLDTNVVSELMRVPRDITVDCWFTVQDRLELSVCSVTVAEIERGINRLPSGKRRDGLRTRFDTLVSLGFSTPILPFDNTSARAFGILAANREKAGFNTNALDLMIAAIALTHNAKLATRNTRDFEGCGIELINPWQETGPS